MESELFPRWWEAEAERVPLWEEWKCDKRGESRTCAIVVGRLDVIQPICRPVRAGRSCAVAVGLLIVEQAVKAERGNLDCGTRGGSRCGGKNDNETSDKSRCGGKNDNGTSDESRTSAAMGERMKMGQCTMHSMLQATGDFPQCSYFKNSHLVCGFQWVLGVAIPLTFSLLGLKHLHALTIVVFDALSEAE